MIPNNPQDKRPQRRPHPLERRPQPEHEPERPRSRATLHIRTVRPWLTYGLIVVNVLIFAIGFLDVARQQQLFFYGVNNRSLVLVEGEYFRLFTAMFLHAGLAHLIFNMLSLYYIGAAVEAMFGHVRFALVYFLGGALGSILSAIMSDVLSVGASGAVFAVFGAQIVHLYNHRKLLGEAGRAQLRTLILIAAMNFSVGVFSAISPEGVRIDNWGHLGGFIGGIVMAWYIAPFYLLERHPDAEQAFIAVDVNPLRKRYQFVSLYLAGVLGILLVAAMMAR